MRHNSEETRLRTSQDVFASALAYGADIVVITSPLAKAMVVIATDEFVTRLQHVSLFVPENWQCHAAGNMCEISANHCGMYNTAIATPKAVLTSQEFRWQYSEKDYFKLVKKLEEAEKALNPFHVTFVIADRSPNE